jgi:hypothetical protein
MRAKLQYYAALDIGKLVLSGDYILAEPPDPDKPVPLATVAERDALVAAAISIAERRAATTQDMRAALQAKNNKVALRLAGQLCGLLETDK